jgi:hypothetical protein
MTVTELVLANTPRKRFAGAKTLIMREDQIDRYLVIVD